MDDDESKQTMMAAKKRVKLIVFVMYTTNPNELLWVCKSCLASSGVYLVHLLIFLDNAGLFTRTISVSQLISMIY